MQRKGARARLVQRQGGAARGGIRPAGRAGGSEAGRARERACGTDKGAGAVSERGVRAGWAERERGAV